MEEASQFDTADCLSPLCLSADYSAQWVLENVKSCKTLHQNVWFGKTKTEDQYIVFNLGCLRRVRKFQILNHFDTVSTSFSVWGVQNYTIKYTDELVVKSQTNWKIVDVDQDILDDYQSEQATCQVPMLTITLSNDISARFIKFTANTYYGNGAALQYFGIA